MEFEISSWKTADMQAGETLQACYPDYTYSYYYSTCKVAWWSDDGIDLYQRAVPVSMSSSRLSRNPCRHVDRLDNDQPLARNMLPVYGLRETWRAALDAWFHSKAEADGSVFDAALIMPGVSNLVYSPLRCDALLPSLSLFFSVHGLAVGSLLEKLGRA